MMVVSSVGTNRLPKSFAKSWFTPLKVGTEFCQGTIIMLFSSTR